MKGQSYEGVPVLTDRVDPELLRQLEELERELAEEERSPAVGWWLIWAAILVSFLALLASFAARAQEPREVTLIFPPGYAVQNGESVTYTPPVVDAIVRSQTIPYLEKIIAWMKPKPPAGMVVGSVTGLAFSPGCPDTAYLAGWVVEPATRVQLRFDSSTIYHEAKLAPTLPGYAKTWQFCLPALYQDGKEHKLYARALRESGTYIGPLDNAKSTARWAFTVPAESTLPPGIPPPPGSTPQPPIVSEPFVSGRVSYQAGSVIVEAAAAFDRVELLIDSRDVAPWYQGVKRIENGRATFALPPEAKDGREHLLDVRLYKPDAPGVFRPDGYPCKAILAP